MHVGSGGKGATASNYLTEVVDSTVKMLESYTGLLPGGRHGPVQNKQNLPEILIGLLLK